mgnify:FL=1
MLNMIMSGFGLILLVFTFKQSYFVEGLNRSFLGLYKGPAENAVVAYDDDGNNIEPYFDQIVFKTMVGDYFEREFSKYMVVYSLDYKFLDSFTHEYSSKPDFASVRIRIYNKPLIKFDKKANFTITRNF